MVQYNVAYLGDGRFHKGVAGDLYAEQRAATRELADQIGSGPAALKLSDERYLPFLAKYKALQDVRRRTLQERTRLLRELNRLTNPDAGNGDETQLKERLKALQDLDTRSESELHKAYEGIDSVLDVRQQARFRLFEEMMERQKLDLLMRARQANRAMKRTK